MNGEGNQAPANAWASRPWLKRRNHGAALAPPFFPSLLFLLGQLIVLAIGASRIELTARSGDLPQRLALPEMIAFQMAIAATAFSTVLNWTTIVGSAIFLYLAALLTGTAAVAECWAIAVVMLWMIALRQLSDLIRGAIAQRITCSLVSTAAIGFPLTQYLIADFSDVHVIWIDPISIAIRQSSSESLLASTIVQSAFCIGLIIFFAACHRASHRP